MISLIIPTYNRCASLRRALESAVNLDYPPDRYEIIIVDNGSTDATAAVVKQMHETDSKHTLRYLREERLGLHNARHAGVWAAHGEILVFTDDDASFDANWLRAYADAFATHTDMTAAAGPIRPIWETPPPEWLIELLRDPNNLGVFSLMEPEEDFRLSSDVMFFGVNMAIRRHVLIDLGGFNPEAFGETWLGDGETGLVYKLRAHHMLIGHVPWALVYHHIPPARMTLKYLRERMANQGACDLYSELHDQPPKTAAIAKRAVRLTLAGARSCIPAFIARNRTDVPSLKIQLEAVRAGSQLRYLLKFAVDKEFQAFIEKKNWLNEFRPTHDSARPQH